MPAAWEKHYSTVIQGLTYQLLMVFNNETDLRNWELLIDQLDIYYHDVHYAIHSNGSEHSIESAAYEFLSLADYFRFCFGNQRVPQNLRLNVQAVERAINCNITDFGFDYGVFSIPD